MSSTPAQPRPQPAAAACTDGIPARAGEAAPAPHPPAALRDRAGEGCGCHDPANTPRPPASDHADADGLSAQGAEAAPARGIAPEPAGEPEPPQRPTRPAMWRGWQRRCPACGAGPLMQSFLTVRAECPACGEVLSHHRADDGPAYLTVLIVGHVVAPLLFLTFFLLRPDPLILASASAIACVALSLYLLPRLKGAIVGLQWAQRMHGFGQE